MEYTLKVATISSPFQRGNLLWTLRLETENLMIGEETDVKMSEGGAQEIIETAVKAVGDCILVHIEATHT